eukprot:CAMPEP_0204117514 /NCGR_PEP_ID=MMETSP0361-20130328/6019_1 /ASSEMBLY_ACC=CAM_ASM_000343 /TAXON_ID=268821 /ORGANISM="Scrippsiella Hangoei, Strain SHTV-5" /LENGTH=74 /DNA_ID=CAMNT_0051068421 /DNA_START=9 /DNA_END=230 /DNA_ORIENTATION=+
MPSAESCTWSPSRGHTLLRALPQPAVCRGSHIVDVTGGSTRVERKDFGAFEVLLLASPLPAALGSPVADGAEGR